MGSVHRRGTWHDKRRAVYTLETNAATAGMAQVSRVGAPMGLVALFGMLWPHAQFP